MPVTVAIAIAVAAAADAIANVVVVAVVIVDLPLLFVTWVAFVVVAVFQTKKKEKNIYVLLQARKICGKRTNSTKPFLWC